MKKVKSQSVAKPSPLAGTNGQLMVTAAHRYCLGRRTYIVGACVEWMRAHWVEFEDMTRCVMLRDTIEALMDDCAGGACDTVAWIAFAEWAWLEVLNPERKWVRHALAHKNKPWPIKYK